MLTGQLGLLEKIGKIEDRRFGTVEVMKSYATGQRLFFKEATYDPKSQEATNLGNWMATRSMISNPNFLSPFEVRTQSKGKLCYSTTAFSFYTEAVDSDLGITLNDSHLQGISGLGDDILMKLLLETATGMSAMESAGISHGHLSPRMIGYQNATSRYLIVEDPLFNEDRIVPTLLSKNEYFFAPKTFELICQGKSLKEGRQIRSDVFSLGLILLQASLGNPIFGIYDMANRGIDQVQLSSWIARMKYAHPNIQFFTSIVERMLNLNEAQRPNFAQVLLEAQQFQTSMRNPSGATVMPTVSSQKPRTAGNNPYQLASPQAPPNLESPFGTNTTNGLPASFENPLLKRIASNPSYDNYSRSIQPVVINGGYSGSGPSHPVGYGLGSIPTLTENTYQQLPSLNSYGNLPMTTNLGYQNPTIAQQMYPHQTFALPQNRLSQTQQPSWRPTPNVLASKVLAAPDIIQQFQTYPGQNQQLPALPPEFKSGIAHPNEWNQSLLIPQQPQQQQQQPINQFMQPRTVSSKLLESDYMNQVFGGRPTMAKDRTIPTHVRSNSAQIQFKAPQTPPPTAFDEYAIPKYNKPKPVGETQLISKLPPEPQPRGMSYKPRPSAEVYQRPQQNNPYALPMQIVTPKQIDSQENHQWTIPKPVFSQYSLQAKPRIVRQDF